MKKILGVFLLTLLLLSCSTNPVTRENFDAGKRPPSRGTGWIASVVPGLSQILNGEYLEAGIYIVGSVIPFVVAEVLYPGEDNMNDIKGGIMASGSFFWAWNYADGVYSNNTRRADWERIAVNKGIAIPIPKRVDISRLHEGMTIDQVLVLFPRPSDINVTQVSNVRREQWVYENYDVYLYFENGYLVGWQY